MFYFFELPMISFQQVLEPFNFGILLGCKFKNLLHPLNPMQLLLQKLVFLPERIVLGLDEFNLLPELLTVFGLEIHILVGTGGLLGGGIQL